MVCELESCDLESWVQKARIHCAPVCVKFFSFFLNPSGLVHPILVYHNFKIKSNLQAQRRSTCRVKLDPNYIPQTFHSGTNFGPVKIWQARPLWVCLLVCLPICLSRTGGSLVPNQSPLQTESQSKTCTPGLWFSKAAWISCLENFICNFQNLTTPKFDNFQNLTTPKFDSAAVSSSQLRARRRDSIGKLESPQY